MTKDFPDLNDDGKVTRADVLKGRGVPGFKGGKWIKEAIKKPGALRKSLGVKGDKPIPAGKLAKAAKAGTFAPSFITIGILPPPAILTIVPLVLPFIATPSRLGAAVFTAPILLAAIPPDCIFFIVNSFPTD